MDPPVAGLADPARVRQWLTLSFVIYLVALVAGSSPRSVGDGGEYLAMSLNLSETGRPWMTDADVARLQAETAVVTGIETWDIRASLKTSPLYGTHDFVHFWLYSAAAQPFVSLARAVGASPIYGFAALNVGLLVLAFWVALPRLGGWLTWLVFAGPVIWWADKAHTEPFTFALLIVAVLLLEEAPVWAVLAGGVAATQNPPILALVPFAAVALGSRSTVALRRPAVWLGLVGALAVACSAVIYYEVRYRMASLLLTATVKQSPSLAAYLTTPFDTNLGIVAAFPFYVLVVGVAVIVTALRPRRLATPSIVLALAMLPVFLMSFAQTSNMHHGGTPGMSRYVLWLVPLGVPFLRELFLHGSTSLKTGIAVVAIVSTTVSTFIFHPKHPDNYREPTWLATLMWTRYPAWTNPAPEVFVDVNDPRGGERLPTATAGCTKALLIGRGESQGMWPVPCYPVEVPAECRTPGALCYANAARPGYRFHPTSDVLESRFTFDPRRTWRRSMEPVVRRVMDEMGWATLTTTTGTAGVFVRERVGIDAMHTLEGAGRSLLVLIGTHEGARLALRLPHKMSARFVDPETGEETTLPAFDGPAAELWHVPVPTSKDIVLLVLRAQ